MQKKRSSIEIKEAQSKRLEKIAAKNDMQEDVKDIAFYTTKGLLALSNIAYPGLGGLASVLMDIGIPSPGARRRDLWIKSVENKVVAISQKLDGDYYMNTLMNEEFQSLFIQATISALKTHKAEKLDLLGNAVINITPRDCEFDFKSILMNIIGEITVTEITILRFFQNHDELARNSNNFQDYLDGYKDYSNEQEITLIQFITMIQGLEKLRLMKLGEVVNPHAEHVRVPQVYGSGASNADGLPYVTLTALGIDILRTLLEYNIEGLKHE